MIHCTVWKANGGRECNCMNARTINMIRATMYVTIITWKPMYKSLVKFSWTDHECGISCGTFEDNSWRTDLRNTAQSIANKVPAAMILINIARYENLPSTISVCEGKENDQAAQWKAPNNNPTPAKIIRRTRGAHESTSFLPAAPRVLRSQLNG